MSKRTDTERMDWLSRRLDNAGCSQVLPVLDVEFGLTADSHAAMLALSSRSWRDIVDAAMDAEDTQ